jgi:DNA-3-methyladenine glycosylase
LIRNYTKLPASFYEGDDVVMLARQLIGKLLITDRDGGRCSGRIIETEAYNGITDKASHAFGGRRTARTEIMYAHGGVAYVYLCYGIHHLFNVVTNNNGIPHAILIRAIEPIEGKEIMMQRFGINKWNADIGAGPGKVTKALGIRVEDSGFSLTSDQLFIADDGFVPEEIIATPRIGVDYAGEDALLPFRFVIPGHRGISAKSFTKKCIA